MSLKTDQKYNSLNVKNACYIDVMICQTNHYLLKIVIIIPIKSIIKQYNISTKSRQLFSINVNSHIGYC